MDDIELNVDVLEKLTRVLSDKLPTIQIGIIEDSVREDGQTNSAVGTAHEFGAPGRNLPERSFLRIPLEDKLNAEIEKSQDFGEEALKEVIKSGSAMSWATSIAKIGKKIVLGAFESNGYGKWVGHSEGYENLTGRILDNTGELKNSIDYKVTK